MNVAQLAKQSRIAARLFRSSTAKERNAALRAIAAALIERREDIKLANAKDIVAANVSGLAASLVDRLLLDDARIENMAAGVTSIAEQPEVVGTISDEKLRPDGLRIMRQTVPLGVIAMIFESRPNVVVDCSALAIKSGNAILLKGGKEAKHSNEILAEICRAALLQFVPENVVQILDSNDRAGIMQLLQMRHEVDVVIPRGGEGLIKMVYENATMPVIAHFKGLCHVYIHEDADLDQAGKICLNAKAQRPGVCNAAETILLHAAIAPSFLPKLAEGLEAAGVELRGCSEAEKIHPMTAATPVDWDTEYLDKIVSIKIVASLDEAIAHIDEHGTFHTEVICAKNPEVLAKFQREVDCSCVVLNASSRFNDGGELGLGAELGISTTKFHAYGPMGAAEMTTKRFVVGGDGHIRD